MRIAEILLLISALYTSEAANECDLRAVENGTVCVCNSTYCDTVPEVLSLSSGEYQLYTTSKDKLGFYSSNGKFVEATAASSTVTISNLNTTYQKITGFGGAFTDAAGINVAMLPADAQDKLLESYFGKDGVQYSMGRVPIGGTDFSPRGYSYCDTKDETLESFALPEEDTKYKIPYIKKAIELRGEDPFRLFATAWSSPTWMKTTDSFVGLGQLKDEYYGLWAEYYIKFFESYKQENISFWGVTTQNEPANGILGFPINNLGFLPDQMNKWISANLGPRIRNSSFSHLKIIAHDESRGSLLFFNEFTLSNDDVVNYLDGVGIHWYSDNAIPPSALELASTSKKDLFKLSTEACTGFAHFLEMEPAVLLGSWERGVSYIEDILENLENDVVGWIDWNMVLDTEGGPTWVGNTVDAPVIANATAGEFYKQPMFYGLGHFSKFVTPGSVRIDATTNTDLKVLAFLRPDEKLALILWNRDDAAVSAEIQILGSATSLEVPASSLNTLLYFP
ncbi:lysosomal acid glucosylceramidase-like [Cylas formicarius]|uniref:lysosomal acid glucosylceramidase-like n=2 Tax=Cylas formicarius TaxID=197179 RepID=UPI002958B202|nr:lysosomal acid glucosylceramidase-like [Cylas formicarius]